MKELAKYLVYRMPIVNSLMKPSYPYKINPGQLAALVDLINDTRNTDSAIIEIGVAQGDTSVFLLEHLRSTGDRRRAVFVDTFNGFTEDSIEFEVKERGKAKSSYGAFKYGSKSIFEDNLKSLGYENFEVIQSDCSKVDWAKIGPIGAVLLDVDLYLPTKAVLESIWPLIVTGGGVVVDDCKEGGAWDGSLRAYQEFIDSKGMSFHRVGDKGGLLLKP